MYPKEKVTLGLFHSVLQRNDKMIYILHNISYLSYDLKWKHQEVN